MVERNKDQTAATHPDPISGAHGAHPVGVGIGTTGGAVAGAALGAVGGSAGVVVGAVVGGVVGGLAGKEVAETFDPTLEDAYWRANYRDCPYVEAARDYGDYAPAYRYGWESHAHAGGRPFAEVEPELGAGWMQARERSSLEWDQARHAARDAWERRARARASHSLPASTKACPP